ncbi:MAG TPA: DUF2304 domain-containing protein [Candidatus Omnitrophota bacterium]|nr:DUF2304 domain-containing protein [Candidatus Omnitrophota bacterium]
MRLIQFLLIPAIAFVVIVYLRRFRTLLLDRLLILAVGVFGIVMILRPDWTSKLANDLGVGRGTDLVSYFGLLGLTFFCLLLWSKLRDLEAKLTEMARAIAITKAEEK